MGIGSLIRYPLFRANRDFNPINQGLYSLKAGLARDSYVCGRTRTQPHVTLNALFRGKKHVPGGALPGFLAW